VPVVDPTPVDGSPGLVRSFMGLDGFDQRYANGGNQFSVEPPDQALCVGNGYVFEAVNDVLRVYQPTGEPASAVTDLNTFYGYPAAINRTSGSIGPFVTDPTCLFDIDTQRWFVTVLTLEVDPSTGDFLGPNHLDIAVSKTANPLDGFTIYRLPVQDDGTQDTPSHRGCPCLGDYPHIGADKYGFYVSTNEYPFSDAPGIFGNNFNGAQIYAFDKSALAAGAAQVNVVQFEDTTLTQGNTTVPGFTLAPAQVPDTAYQTADNGTQYFLDSVASEEAQPSGFTGQAEVIGVYTLTNTRSISSSNPALKLSGALRPSERYVNPPLATQKFGPTPLGNYCSQVDCFGFGPGQFAEGAHRHQRQPDAAGLLRPRPALRLAEHRSPGLRPAAGRHRLVPGRSRYLTGRQRRGAPGLRGSPTPERHLPGDRRLAQRCRSDGIHADRAGLLPECRIQPGRQ
jgi:hypothetical protein